MDAPAPRKKIMRPRPRVDPPEPPPPPPSPGPVRITIEERPRDKYSDRADVVRRELLRNGGKLVAALPAISPAFRFRDRAQLRELLSALQRLLAELDAAYDSD